MKDEDSAQRSLPPLNDLELEMSKQIDMGDGEAMRYRLISWLCNELVLYFSNYEDPEEAERNALCVIEALCRGFEDKTVEFTEKIREKMVKIRTGKK